MAGRRRGRRPDRRAQQPGDLVVADRRSAAIGSAASVSLPVRAAAGRRAAPGRAAGHAGQDRHRGPAVRGAASASGWPPRRPRRRHGVGAAAGRRGRAAAAPWCSGRSPTPRGARCSARGRVPGGLAALRSLRLAGPALGRWAAACGPRQVLLAGPRSFCAGVERAIEIVERVLDRHGRPVYVRKQIVHNTPRGDRPGAATARSSSTSSTRCPTARPWCSPRTGCRRRCATRPRGAASGRSTRPARWWPRCTPRRAGSPPRATRWCSSGTPGTRRSRARSARRRRPSTLVETAEPTWPGCSRRTRARSPT